MKYLVILVLVLVAVVAAVEEGEKKVVKRGLWGSPIFPIVGVNPLLTGIPLPLWTGFNPWGLNAFNAFGGIGFL